MNNMPKDFHTLVRFTIMTKLCKNSNLHTRQFMSSDGTSIYMIVKANEQVIKKEAEEQGLTKQLELGKAGPRARKYKGGEGGQSYCLCR